MTPGIHAVVGDTTIEAQRHSKHVSVWLDSGPFATTTFVLRLETVQALVSVLRSALQMPAVAQSEEEGTA